jgi:hypothetical protein
MDTAKKEAEMTMCGALGELLEKTGASQHPGCLYMMLIFEAAMQ